MSLCPLCRIALRPGRDCFRDNRYGLEGEVVVGWCPKCGLGVTLNALTRRELATLYATCYGEPEDAQRQVPASGVAARIWRRVNGSMPLADERYVGPVLDVGCNRGELLAALRGRGYDVVGLEPNREAAAAARGQGLEVIEESIEEAELPLAGFGSIILSNVLEHVDDPHAALRRLRPALRDDGRLYVVVPSVASIWRYVFGANWAHWHVPFHLYHHTRRSLALLLAQSGFALESARDVTPGEWLVMSLQATRNARRGVYRLEPFRGHYGRRLALAPLGRTADALGRGDAIYAVARPN